MIKAVFHIHSKYSRDSISSLEAIARFCQKKNIQVVFLADHDNLAPSATINGVRIVGNEEIKTAQGEIIGLFIKEKIASGLPLAETIQKIKAQGGLVVIPHHFNSLIRRFSGKRISAQNLLDNLTNIDAIEIFNARNVLASDNQKALEFARQHQKIKIVGSDAHLIAEIDNTYFMMNDWSTPQEFLTNLASAEFHTKTASIFHQFFSLCIRIVKKYFRR
ncbi:MAG: PHP domain-containing protein [Candidatus Parcubacteria bacterium]|nr:PHP domain-containing protein [Candidatus Parcubacteria bacterium]